MADDERMTQLQLAMLAWNMIDTMSRDETYMHQLTPEQWMQLGQFMADQVRHYQFAQEFARECERASRTATPPPTH